MSWLNALGWLGSALLIFSLLQARVLRFRVLNLTASSVLSVFNALLGIWPMVAMNLALMSINLWFIRKLLTERHDPSAYQVLEVGPADAYLRHVLSVHADDIHRFFPDLAWDASAEPLEADPPAAGRPAPEPSAPDPSGAERSAFLVQRGDETVGVVVVRDAGDGVAQVELDYVTPRFRDFSPGEFVYRRSGLFSERGFRRVVTPPGMVAPYYDRLGFQRDGTSYRLDLA